MIWRFGVVVPEAVGGDGLHFGGERGLGLECGLHFFCVIVFIASFVHGFYVYY